MHDLVLFQVCLLMTVPYLFSVSFGNDMQNDSKLMSEMSKSQALSGRQTVVISAWPQFGFQSKF